MGTKLWSGVSVAVQSAIAAPKTINSISKANPGVVNSTAHGYSNGDYVLLEVQGMYQVDKRVFRVASVATDTFQLEGEDTTAYDTFVSGTAKKLTLGITAGTFVDVQPQGGGFEMIDDSDIHSLVKKEIPGQAEPIRYTFESRWEPTDAALKALRDATKTKALLAVMIAWPDGTRILFVGYCATTLLPAGSAQGKVTCQVVITCNGMPTTYGT